MTEPFISQLAEICAREPTRAKWVFVPGHDVGLALGDRLALGGGAWANLRFVTPLDIATRMAAPFLLERGIEPSDDTLGPALVMRLMLDLPGGAGYFRPMIEHASMAAALWRTLGELRYAGVRASHLAATPFTGQADKREEVIALLAAYERYLHTTRVADMPMVFEEAIAHQDWSPVGEDDIVIELPDAVWPPVVRRFVDAIPGRRIAARVAALPDVPVPARVFGLRPKVEAVALETPTDASRLRFLQSVQSAGTPRGDGTLALFHAGGRDAEVEEVFRRILAAGSPLDEVEIACASDVYQPLVREKAVRLGWKVTTSAGFPAAATRPGRLLLRYCDWIAGGFAASDLRRLLQSGDCRLQVDRADALPCKLGETDAGGWRGVEGDGVDPDRDAGTRDDETGLDLSPGQAARLLLKARATCGRATYGAALARLAEQYERAAANQESSEEDRAWNARKHSQARALREWVAGVLSMVPWPEERAGSRVALSQVVRGAIEFIDANAARSGALDHVARQALVESLAELDVLGEYSCTLADALVFLRERAGSRIVSRERARPGHLHVSSLARAGYSGRRTVFVVGLQEGGVFPPAVEDPVLLDLERRAISPLLATSVNRQDEAVFDVLTRLAAIGASAERVCLSFSCFDTRDFRETFPSWIVLQAYRLVEGNPSLSYDDLARWLGEPASAVPASQDLATSDASWWLARRAGESERDAILLAYPPLARGVYAEAQRASREFSEFDGHVEMAGAALDPTRSTRPVSATTLEKAAKCPLRFFMEQGLGVRVIEEDKVGEDAWLDAATKGSELHSLFARSVRRMRDEKRKAALEVDRPQLLAWARERLNELREEMPPPSEEVFARESREFLDDLDAFVRAECEGRHGAHPVGLEVAFGFPVEDAEGEALASADPVRVEVDGKRAIRLHGRIDRINRTAPGEYEVVDYKTGGYWADAWKGEFAGGTRLQHALYGVAAVTLLKPGDPKARVLRGVYIFPATKGHRQRRCIPAPSKARLAQVLGDLADLIACGAFVAADGEDACRWCDFSPACHVGDLEHVAAKRDHGANAALEAYRRLRGHP